MDLVQYMSFANFLPDREIRYVPYWTADGGSCNLQTTVTAPEEVRPMTTVIWVLPPLVTASD